MITSYGGFSVGLKRNAFSKVNSRYKINPKNLSPRPVNNYRPTSVTYQGAKIRGRRSIGPFVPQFQGIPLLGYKKQSAFVHTLKRSVYTHKRRPLTQSEYTAVRSGLSKQKNAAYMHRVTFIGRPEFKAGRNQLKSAGYRRSYVRPTAKVVYSPRVHRRYRRNYKGQFAGSM